MDISGGFNNKHWPVLDADAEAHDELHRLSSSDLMLYDEFQPLIEDDYGVCSNDSASGAIKNLEDLKPNPDYDCDYLKDVFAGMNDFDVRISGIIETDDSKTSRIEPVKIDPLASIEKSANPSEEWQTKAHLYTTEEDRKTTSKVSLDSVQLKPIEVKEQSAIRKCGNRRKEHVVSLASSKPKLSGRTRKLETSDGGLNPKLLKLKAPRQKVIRQTVPDNEKDDKYYMHREKNTEAARKCRQRKRAIDEERVALLKKQQQEIVHLNEKIARLKREVKFYFDFTNNLKMISPWQNDSGPKRGGTRRGGIRKGSVRYRH